HLTFAPRAYEVARWYRARGALVVLGGPHVQSCPSEAREHADALVFSGGVAAASPVSASAGVRTCLPKLPCGSFG
ncbi:MAG TPA: hypothetical protein VFV33_18600, partial [Gemmatimonadaceae bacterium]|nr:hypothetical protein [Gemmatimonadaceae bacterium]